MKKEKKIKGHYTLVDTHNPTSIYGFDSFQDYCDACDDDGVYNRESEEDWYKWAADEMEGDFDCLMDNLKYSKLFHYPVIVEGSLGLWWGRPEVEQKYFSDVLLAIRACIDGAYDVVIKKAGHKLEVVNMHHDGSNCFTITFLTDLGDCRYLEHGKVSTKNAENCLKLPEFLF